MSSPNCKEQKQGCQLPDFSLRSQTSGYTADFPTTFLYIYLKLWLFHFRSQNNLQYFYSILQIKFCEPRQKREERTFSAGTYCAWAGSWLVVTRTLSTLKSFQTFLRHNVGNPEQNFRPLFDGNGIHICWPIFSIIKSLPTLQRMRCTDSR